MECVLRVAAAAGPGHRGGWQCQIVQMEAGRRGRMCCFLLSEPQQTKSRERDTERGDEMKKVDYRSSENEGRTFLVLLRYDLRYCGFGPHTTHDPSTAGQLHYPNWAPAAP
jgi:hypothetical protein